MGQQLKYDIIVGEDGTLKLRAFGEEVEHTGDELEDTGKKSDVAGKKIDEVGKRADKSSSKFKGFQNVVQRAAGSALAMSSSALSLVGPLTSLGAATAHFVVAAGPALGILPALGAGALFLRQVIVGTGPAMTKALAPVTAAWAAQETVVGRLATAGLPKLSKAFVRVDMPSITAAAKDIGEAINGIVTAVGEWLTSSAGLKAVKALMSGVSNVVTHIAPGIADVAISFLELVGRGAQAFGTGSSLNKGLEKLSHLIDSISLDDIRNGLSTAKNAAEALGGKLQLVIAAVMWMGNHVALVKAFSDAVAVLGIVLGALSGNWLAVAIGAFSLLANHFKELSSAFHSAQTSSGPLHNALQALSAIGTIIANWWRSDLLPALKQAAAVVMPALRNAVASVSKTLHDNHEMITQTGQVLKVLGAFITTIVIPAYAQMAKFILGQVGPAFAVIATVINHVVLPAIRAMISVFVNAFGIILNGAAKALGWIPGIGPKLKSAAAQFGVFRDQVNAALAGIRDKNVQVTVNGHPVSVIHQGSGVAFSGGGSTHHARAGGGPVIAGTSYRVGERGEETFTPRASGFITPGRAGGKAGTGDVHYHFTVNGFVGNEVQLGRELQRITRTARNRGAIVGAL